jgi:hypothetical protein
MAAHALTGGSTVEKTRSPLTDGSLHLGSGCIQVRLRSPVAVRAQVPIGNATASRSVCLKLRTSLG